MEYAATYIIKDKLLEGLDHEYNVVNTDIVNKVLIMLEETRVTKEALEITRLGKIVNDLRKKTNDRDIALRAKELVKKWRNALLSGIQKQNTHEALPSQNSKWKRKRNADCHDSARKYIKRENQLICSNATNRYEQASDGQLIIKSYSSPPTDTFDSRLSKRKRMNEESTIKYSTGLPTIFLNRFYKVSPQSCGPDDDDQRSSPSSNSCSPPLILQRTDYLSYTGKVIKSGNPAAYPYSRSSDSYPSTDSSEKFKENYLSVTRHKPGNLAIQHDASDIVASNSSKEKNDITEDCRYPEREIEKNEYSGEISSLGSKASCPEVVFTGSTVEESYNFVPSSPIKLRSHTNSHVQDDILMKNIQRASRVGQTSKIKTTKEILQNMTMVGLATNQPNENEIVKPLFSNTDTSVANETESASIPLKEDVLSSGVEVDSPVTEILSKNMKLETKEALIKQDADEILAKLPQIDVPKILAEMQAELEIQNMEKSDSEKRHILYQHSELSEYIIDQSIEGITGNFSFDGRFKRWNEVVSKPSYSNNLLHILPYTVIE